MFGALPAWQCEVDPHASTVLEHRFPGVPNHGDITAVDWAAVEPVDVICGGTPCQDMSSAGLRAGMAEGTRSGLWSHMLAAIATIRPALVVWENVQGALSARAVSNMEPDPRYLGGDAGGLVLRAAGRVVGDLAGLGYDACWAVVAAFDVGAPHRRNRVFIVAADADGPRLEGPWLRRRPLVCGDGAAVALLPTPRTSDTNGAGVHGQDGLDLRTAVALLPTPAAADGTGGRRAINPARWGQYASAIARWEQVIGRDAPAPTDDKGRLNPELPEWMMGWSAGWVTDLLTRTQALKVIGNGVCPQQAAHALGQLLPPLFADT